VLRRHRRSTREGETAQLRDTASYSIITEQWPGVRRQLTARLDDGNYA
jgi:hypothetical protein